MAVKIPCRVTVSPCLDRVGYEAECETCNARYFVENTTLRETLGRSPTGEPIHEAAMNYIVNRCPRVAEALADAAAQAAAEKEAAEKEALEAERAELQSQCLEIPAGGAVVIESIDGGGFRVTQVMQDEANDGVGESEENEAES